MTQKHNVNAIFTPLNHLPQELYTPRLREDILRQIYNNPIASLKFAQLNNERQEALIQFCMGNRGLKITYDPFFHKIFNPEIHPDRLNRFLSAIMNQPVKVIKVHPREGIRLAENASLVIMDILVELEDGSLINVEIQKCGYNFPIQRSFCYGADMLARQYAKLKAEKQEHFSYKEMRPIYVIVLMEESPAEFKKYPNNFIHRSHFTFETELPLESLLNFIYISLDIFRNMHHNEIEELDAWMYFLSSDDPQHIQLITEKYPFFQELYQEIINFRYQPEELITMYNEILAIMDHNTVMEMIEDKNGIIAMKDAEIADKDAKIADKDAKIADKDAEIADKEAEIADKDAKIADKDAEIADKDAKIAFLEAKIAEMYSSL